MTGSGTEFNFDEHQMVIFDSIVVFLSVSPTLFHRWKTRGPPLRISWPPSSRRRTPSHSRDGVGCGQAPTVPMAANEKLFFTMAIKETLLLQPSFVFCEEKPPPMAANGSQFGCPRGPLTVGAWLWPVVNGSITLPYVIVTTDPARMARALPFPPLFFLYFIF